MTIKVLLDNNLRSLAIFLKPVSKRISEYNNRLALLKAHEKPEHFKAKQVESLPTIAHLEERGDISIYTHKYLHLEAMLRPKSHPYHKVGDLLRSCQFTHLESPLDHRLLDKTDLKNQKTKIINLVNTILGAGSPEHVRFLFAEDNKIDVAESVKVLELICKSLHETHYDDAFHFWISNISGIDVFLTADKRFTNALRQNPKSKELHCKVMYASDFLEHMGITELIPLPFEYGLTYTISGLPYD